MTTTTVFVSIGRNVGADPLPAKKWQAFQWRVGAILAHVAPILAKFTGQDEWEGQTEETAGWLVSFPSLQQAEETRAFVHLVAAECYGQESVGFTWLHSPKHNGSGAARVSSPVPAVSSPVVSSLSVSAGDPGARDARFSVVSSVDLYETYELDDNGEATGVIHAWCVGHAPVGASPDSGGLPDGTTCEADGCGKQLAGPDRLPVPHPIPYHPTTRKA